VRAEAAILRRNSAKLQRRLQGKTSLVTKARPGLDVATLQAKYGAKDAQRPRVIEGSFMIPVGASEETYYRERETCVKAFIEAFEAQGWHWETNTRIQVFPNRYPAYDLKAEVMRPDMVEFSVRAQFVFEKPEPMRIELPPDLLEDQSVRVNVADDELEDAYVEDEKQARALHERRLHPARG
jgi:hypothetical protein